LENKMTIKIDKSTALRELRAVVDEFGEDHTSACIYELNGGRS
jgi:hypothetical protein